MHAQKNATLREYVSLHGELLQRVALGCLCCARILWCESLTVIAPHPVCCRCRQSIVAQTAKWSEKQGSRGAGKSKEELKREEQECVHCKTRPSKLSLNGSCCHVPNHRGDCVTREETEITEMARQLQVIRRERLRRLYQGETAQYVVFSATGRSRTRVIVRCGWRQVGACAECTRASISEGPSVASEPSIWDVNMARPCIHTVCTHIHVNPAHATTSLIGTEPKVASL